jgi:hypothetical protein
MEAFWGKRKKRKENSQGHGKVLGKKKRKKQKFPIKAGHERRVLGNNRKERNPGDHERGFGGKKQKGRKRKFSAANL